MDRHVVFKGDEGTEAAECVSWLKDAGGDIEARRVRYLHKAHLVALMRLYPLHLTDGVHFVLHQPCAVVFDAAWRRRVIHANDLGAHSRP